MKIGVIQAGSQIGRNALMLDCVREAAPEAEVVNFGCFEGEEEYSYVEIALEAALLLAGGAADFIVTGCSSGQGMMLACNSLPGVVCGYLPTPQDAYLFGRINGGNAASLPLGLGFGWAGELNLRYTLRALFDGGFGTGYPPKDAERKARDTAILKRMNAAAKIPMAELLPKLDAELVDRALSRRAVTEYLLRHTTDPALREAIVGKDGTK